MLKESAFVLFLVHSNFNMNVVGRHALRTRDDTLQPFVTFVFFLGITIMVFAMSAWGRLDAIGSMALAAT